MDETHRQKPQGGVRSRKGCLTCRSKKVKCDEQRLNCGRCRRLGLKCRWTTGSPSRVKDTAKSRARAAPAKILPNLPHVHHDSLSTPYGSEALPGMLQGVVDVPKDTAIAREEDTSLGGFSTYDGAYDGAHPVALWDDWNQELGFGADFLDIGNFVAQESLDEILLDVASKSLTPTLTHESSTPMPWLSNLSSPLSIFTPGLSMQNIALSPSFAQTAKEMQALHHYKTCIPTLSITKNVLWSSHMVMLRYESQTPMVMHLLIAASLMSLGASQQYDTDICSAARDHARAGAHLLINAMNSGAQPDHISLLTAFFFLYHYMKKQKNTDPQAMAQLSQAVCNCVQKYGLDALCAKSLPPSTSSTEVTVGILAQDKREWLSRLMVWIFYEDVLADIRGYGGSLARYLCAEPEQTGEIYQYSTRTLESAWGSEYPESEIIDDIENGSILKFFYEVMRLYNEVNEVFRSSSLAVTDQEEVEAKIIKLEEHSRLLFRLTTITTLPRSRVMINADYMVAYFYALRIYKFRCFQQDNHATTPPEVQTSLNSILRIAQRSFSSLHEEQMVERFQWPLFMAGIETSDGIHKEWIHAKMRKASLSRAFKRILEIQDISGRRVSMPLIRQIMCGEGPQNSLRGDPMSAFSGAQSDKYFGQLIGN